MKQYKSANWGFAELREKRDGRGWSSSLRAQFHFDEPVRAMTLVSDTNDGEIELLRILSYITQVLSKSSYFRTPKQRLPASGLNRPLSRGGWLVPTPPRDHVVDSRIPRSTEVVDFLLFPILALWKRSLLALVGLSMRRASAWSLGW